MIKILMVNKFLYPNGGSETYIFRLGEELKKLGSEVQYFGMEHEGRIVGNHAECYTSDMDFHSGGLQKLIYPLKIIYSVEARRKIRRVLEDFQPDIVHLNNFNFQLTPSILYEIRSYSRKHKQIRTVFTAHDCQLVCPNHLMRIPATGENCERCIDGKFGNCIRHRCIHNSLLKSMLGSVEGYLYRILKTYRLIDCVICPSYFMEKRMEKVPGFQGKTVVMHNFVDVAKIKDCEKKDYVLYFGRYSEEKGIHTLLSACRQLPEIPFMFAGNGPLENEVGEVSNVQNLGFLTGVDLQRVISEARFVVCPSECYENCPFSVMEALKSGTPVLGAAIGGIPELICEGENGEYFESGNVDELSRKINDLWNDKDKRRKYSENCRNVHFDTLQQYCKKLMQLYENKKLLS